MLKKNSEEVLLKSLINPKLLNKIREFSDNEVEEWFRKDQAYE